MSMALGRLVKLLTTLPVHCDCPEKEVDGPKIPGGPEHAEGSGDFGLGIERSKVHD